MRRMARLMSLLFAVANATLAFAQDATLPGSAAAPVLPDADASDEIIIRALRIPKDKLPTRITLNYQTALGSKISYERSEMFAKCVGTFDPVMLSKVIDGPPGTSSAHFAQGWIIVTNRACYPGYPSGSADGDIRLKGTSKLDRGAILEAALRLYAPDAALTLAETEDLVVRRRFNRTESRRNRFRLKSDLDALLFSACLVRVQPELTTRLVRSSPGSDLESGLEQAILIQGRDCLGTTKAVTIDPTMLRVYLVDAFYRWVVAARGIPSLLPVTG